MSVRFVLPVAAVALMLGIAGGSYAQSSSPTQVRPAQTPQATDATSSCERSRSRCLARWA